MRAIQSSTLSHLKCTIKIFDTYHIEEEFAMSPCFRIILVVVKVTQQFYDIYVLLMGKGRVSVVDLN